MHTFCALPRIPSTDIRCRVVIIEDHEAIIGMMVPIVDSLPGYKVVGQTTQPEEAVSLCERLQPDEIIMDWVMPRMTGPALLHALKQVCPRARTIVFSGNLWPAAIRAALAGGVLGIIDKMAPLDVFRTALQSVAAGKVYFSPAVSEQIKQLLRRDVPDTVRPVMLSKRENAVLRYIAQGYSSKEIAAALGISVYTVINHRANLMRKVGLRRAAQLSLYAAQVGLINGGLAPGVAAPGVAAASEQSA